VRLAALAVILFAGVSALSAKGQAQNGSAAPPASAPQTGTAKYVFLFIGDGMAMPQISAAEVFATARASKDVSVTRLAFTRFPVAGLVTTYDAGTFITDSASAVTALATGNKTLSGVINMDVSKSRAFKTIAEYARDQGRKVGVVSSVTLNHATPAGFYAKAPSRGDYYGIALQLAASGFDYFAGGAVDQHAGKGGGQPSALDLARANGYTYVNSNAAFASLKRGAGKVIAVNAVLQDAGAMPYAIDRKPGDLSLADYTRKGIELLEDGPQGFFMAVEGGKVDWACHANDAGASILDVLDFDAAVRVALDFARAHPADTLIVVTGDHETGGMTLGFAGTQYDTFFDKVALQRRSFISFNDEVLAPYKRKMSGRAGAKLADLLPDIEASFGLDFAALSAYQREQLEQAFRRSLAGEKEASAQPDVQYLLYGGYEPLTVKLTQIMNQTAGIGWTSYAHTGVPVPVFAAGARSELFGGYYDNTDVFGKLADAMGIPISN
jgi:alkaline phosphatase